MGAIDFLKNSIIFGVARFTRNTAGDISGFSEKTNIPYSLFKFGTPVHIAPSGTMANNGAVTFGTALQNAYPGVWMYFPANAIVAGSAEGFYWTVMSTTTVGTVYNNTRAMTDLPTRIASPTPFVTTGPGAFVGVTTIVNAYQTTLPGGVMGKNGIITVDGVWSYNNSAGAKIGRVNFGGQTVLQLTSTTTVIQPFRRRIANQGSEALQYSTRSTLSDPGAASTQPGQYTAIDTTADVTIVLTIDTGVDTDYMCVEWAECLIEYGN